MSQGLQSLPKRGFGETSRTDKWWLQPLIVLSGLSAFIVYATWAAFVGDHYAVENLLSPFYSPVTWYDPDVDRRRGGVAPQLVRREARAGGLAGCRSVPRSSS